MTYNHNTHITRNTPEVLRVRKKIADNALNATPTIIRKIIAHLARLEGAGAMVALNEYYIALHALRDKYTAESNAKAHAYDILTRIAYDALFVRGYNPVSVDAKIREIKR